MDYPVVHACRIANAALSHWMERAALLRATATPPQWGMLLEHKLQTLADRCDRREPPDGPLRISILAKNLPALVPQQL